MTFQETAMRVMAEELRLYHEYVWASDHWWMLVALRVVDTEELREALQLHKDSHVRNMIQFREMFASHN
jgi:hypothetical protein